MLIMLNTYLDIILRSAAVYFFVFIAIRITGKKEISQLSIVDFVLVILVSNAVQNSMVGPDTSLVGGLIAAAVLFLIDYVIKFITYRNRKAKRLLEGVPVLLVYKGKRMDKNLASEKISNDELDAAVRAHGILSTDHVALAVLETNGLISVIAAD
jgi:uncharacterized membrane protein YcaP (DUF421 family)